MLLGCIGDDFTGSSDIANTLAKAGMRVTQYTGVPETKADSTVEAGVVSLKSRTIAVEDAINQSIAAANWLLEQGCEQLFFKYCSTFDSTPQGNIGPVAEALARLVGENKVVFCPAFPATGRSIYQGNLFVNDIPLHESGMKDHPLTPMTDSDLRRWLALQTDYRVHHLAYATVKKGHAAIAGFLEEADEGFFIADAIDDHNLVDLGHALKGRKLVTGGSGLAMGLPGNFGLKPAANAMAAWRGLQGKAAILSGSCSNATRAQVEHYKSGHPSMELTAQEIVAGDVSPASVFAWIEDQTSPPLVYTSADPAIVREAQNALGRERVADSIETFFGALASTLADNGYQRIVSAGGETSGAIVSALKIRSMEIGPEIAPGVPALRDGNRDLVLALKSGNFGGGMFFQEALEVLAS